MSSLRVRTSALKILGFLRQNLGLVSFLAFSLILRIFVFRIVTPWIHTDTITYLILGQVDTVRTPGYPFFIEVIQFFNDLFSLTPAALKLVAFFQMFLLGMINSALIYAFSRFITRSQGFAWAMGLIYNLNYFVVGFEFLILTETLALTLLGLTLLFYWRIFKGKKRAHIWAGIFSVWLLLTRPTFMAFFALLVGLTGFVYFRSLFKGGFLKKYAKPLLVFLIINLVGIGSWSLRNKVKYDYFGVSSILPYQLGYYTHHFVKKYHKGGNEELDKYADILIQERGLPYNFAARLEGEGMPQAAISRILLKLNLRLIRENFSDYLRLVPRAAASYFNYSWYWMQGHDRGVFQANPLPAAGWNFFFSFYKPIFRIPIVLLCFGLLIPVAFIVGQRKNRDVFHLLCLIFGTVLFNTLISVVLTNAGANNLRFRVPVEPFMLLLFWAALFTWGKNLLSRVKTIRLKRR